MSGWDMMRWVSDEGLRCYFSEPDAHGLSRLECYRRLLDQSAAPTPPTRRVPNPDGLQAARLWRLANLLELATRHRRVHV